MAMDRLPPLRFGAQPLAGKHGNKPSPWRGKLNVQGPSQKKAQLVQKSSHALARRRPKGLTHSLKLNPEQKAASTRKVIKAAQSSSARGRKCKEIGHRLCRGTAPKNQNCRSLWMASVQAKLESVRCGRRIQTLLHRLGLSTLEYPNQCICRCIRTRRRFVSAAILRSVRRCTLRIPCTEAVRG